MANLTDFPTCVALAIDPADLTCPWENIASKGQTSPAWALAWRLSPSGIAAVIVPSFAPGATALDRNVVFWRWSGARPGRVVVIDNEARLPKDDRS